MSMKENSLSRTLVLNDQGGQFMSVDFDRTATLRAEMHGRPPIVLCIEPRSQDGVPRIYSDEISHTLNTAQGGAKATVCLDNKR